MSESAESVIQSPNYLSSDQDNYVSEHEHRGERPKQYEHRGERPKQYGGIPEHSDG